MGVQGQAASDTPHPPPPLPQAGEGEGARGGTGTHGANAKRPGEASAPPDLPTPRASIPPGGSSRGFARPSPLARARVPIRPTPTARSPITPRARGTLADHPRAGACGGRRGVCSRGLQAPGVPTPPGPSHATGTARRRTPRARTPKPAAAGYSRIFFLRISPRRAGARPPPLAAGGHARDVTPRCREECTTLTVELTNTSPGRSASRPRARPLLGSSRSAPGACR